MNAIKYLFISAVLMAVVSCSTETYDDVSFVNSAVVPSKVSALFNITQDNSGLVTITPNGESSSTYDISFGDGTSTTTAVKAGGNVQHTYAEGVFSVKVVAYNLSGKTAEATQSLTVSFRAPEELEVNAAIDASDVFKVNVSATALYETLFKVYFGDGGESEVPQSFLEGATVSHSYTEVGTYTVKVVALSGGVATTEYTKEITIVNPVLMPVDFENSTLVYNFGNFGGGVLSVIDNPQSSGLNTSTKVAQMVKNNGDTWGGSSFKLGSPIDFSVNKIFRMKVYSPRVGAKVLLKVENPSDNSIFYEKEVSTTVSNQWEDLVFDYSEINTANAYQTVVLIFDNGTKGDGTSDYTFLIDDIRLTNSIPTATGISLYSFESGDFSFTNFDGGGTTVITNPYVTGINLSSKVGQMIKSSGQPWGGSWIDFGSDIDFSKYKTFKMKVYSPRAGVKVLLKVENASDSNKNYEKEVTTTVANQWEELSFDYSEINTANTYSHIVLIFENGTMGDGTADFTFLFDDITLN